MIRSFTPTTSTESAWHYLPVTTASWQRPRSYPSVVQSILLPIQYEYLTDMVVTSVLDFAAKIKMDLVLLVVCENNTYDRELLFSALRGFRAHAQRFGEVALTIDTAVGYNDETISQYADSYGVDVVILPNQLAKFESKEQEKFALFANNWQPLV
ncbi:MAG: hypothetical protein H6654_04850 [Ardenticatenaceae bacterium]|nr:hypothetical protein [Anaerolineales bacterium]MCB8941755.1 hypothetical protein [Ardenticatenaceae bacterium]MCB8972866.1 hypothetical protein [Ardenticatenaceae bacterium]